MNERTVYLMPTRQLNELDRSLHIVFILYKVNLTVSFYSLGVLGSLKTCLHSVLQLVSIGADLYNPSGCHMTHPKLAEACYHLLYILCHNQELSENTMRYLRNNHNFFHVQLNCVPFPWLQQLEEPNIVISLKQQAWILCSVALEMRMTTLKNQRSHAQKLVSLLLKSTTLTEQFNETVNNIPMWSTAVNLDFESTQDSTSMLQDGRRKILTILDYISFDTVPVPPLQLQFFDQERTESVISSCETTMQDDSGFSYIDIQTLHTLLMSELNSIQGAAVLSQKHFILEVGISIFTAKLSIKHTHISYMYMYIITHIHVPFLYCSVLCTNLLYVFFH